MGFPREDYEERLKALANTPPPRKLSMGAMCYSPAPPTEVAIYACPRCGARSLLSGDEYPLAVWQVDACRKLMRELGDLPAALLEEGFCENCDPDAERSTLALLVQHGDGASHRVDDVWAEDLILLKEFLAGRKIHKGPRDEESSIRDHIPRIRELLGLPLKSSE